MHLVQQVPHELMSVLLLVASAEISRGEEGEGGREGGEKGREGGEERREGGGEGGREEGEGGREGGEGRREEEEGGREGGEGIREEEEGREGGEEGREGGERGEGEREGGEGRREEREKLAHLWLHSKRLALSCTQAMQCGYEANFCSPYIHPMTVESSGLGMRLMRRWFGNETQRKVYVVWE